MTNLRRLPRWAQLGVYPVVLAFNIAVVALDIHANQPGRHAALLVGFNVLGLMLLEYYFPMDERWRMTWHTAQRDLFFIAFGIASIVLSNWALTWFAIAVAPSEGWLHELPVIPATIAALVAAEFFQYWLHRFMHEGRGALGAFAWRVHRPHHVLDRVYLLMHARFHPIEAFLTRAVFIVPLAFLGISADALYAMSIIVGLQGLVGHLNVELRAGWLNYLLTGTELHRYHHSADLSEAKNYGNFLPLFDMIFGTFVYRPERRPAMLGVRDEGDGPNADATFAHFIHPFRR